MDNITAAEEGELLTVSEAAKIMRISLRTAYEAAHRGEIPAVKILGQWRVGRAALLKKLGAEPA